MTARRAEMNTAAENDSDEIRADLVARGIEPVIPARPNRKTSIA
jgi:hypothetical protein